MTYGDARVNLRRWGDWGRAMRKLMTFFGSGVLVLALAAPASAVDRGSANRGSHARHPAAGTELSPDGVPPGQYEANQYRHGDRYRDGRWYYRDGRWYYYRDGRWYHRDQDGRWSSDRGQWYYRDGRWYYRDQYGRWGYPHGRHDGRYGYYYGGSPTRHCHDGEWRYHPQAGWMCV
jgi:hypothetical protein